MNIGAWRAALLASFALAYPAAAETLPEALADAHRTNPNMEDARLGVRAAREGRAQVFARYLPSVDIYASAGDRTLVREPSGSIFQSPRSETETSPTTSSAQVTQPIYTGGRRGAEMRLARSGLNSARNSVRTIEQNVMLATIEAYVGVRRDEEILALRVAYMAGLERQVAGARRRLEVGEVTRTDLAQAQSRLAGARANLLAAQASLLQTRARYAEIVGHEAADLAPPPTPPAPPESLQNALALAEAHHPELEQAREGVRAARARVGIERSALLPQLSLVGQWSRAEEQDLHGQVEESGTTMAQVSLPLFEGGYAWSRVRQGHINVARAEAGVEAQRRAVMTDVTSRWSVYEASAEIVEASREQSELAEQAWRGAEREHTLGLRSTIDVLDAELEWRQTQIALARAQAEAYAAAYALQAAIGALTYDAVPATSLR